MLEKDMHGLYEQCLQCGYIRDLQVINWATKEQAEEQNDEDISQCITAEGSNDELQNQAQLTEYSHIEDLTVPPNLQLILNYLLKEQQNNPH
jgi:hypothetical protein